MVTSAFLTIILAFSIYCFYDRNKLQKYLFHPYSIKHNNEHYRFLTHAFIHGNTMHLFFNVFALWMFGYIIEDNYYVYLFGEKMAKVYYILLFTGGIYASSVTEYFRNRNNPSYSSLGASGAIEAIIFSYIIITPFQTLYFIVIPMPAWLLGILFLAGSFYLSKRKRTHPNIDNIGHEAHFWGAIFGIVFTLVLKPELALNFVKAISL